MNCSRQSRSVGFDALYQLLHHKSSFLLWREKRNASYKLDTVDQRKIQCIKHHPPNPWDIWPFFLEKNFKILEKFLNIDFIIITTVNNESWEKLSVKRSLYEGIQDNPTEHREKFTETAWFKFGETFQHHLFGWIVWCQRIMAIISSTTRPFKS